MPINSWCGVPDAVAPRATRWSASVEARNTNYVTHEDKNPVIEEWTDRVVRKLTHAPGSPNLAHRIWPPIK